MRHRCLDRCQTGGGTRTASRHVPTTTDGYGELHVTTVHAGVVYRVELQSYADDRQWRERRPVAGE